ncbi:SAG-related sequence [Besnoitia besnoiti]|uniref:SAG-related sequence n=1 Tax=Besnoitia besnoiti TaxID=94643 RepID=A0A2A9MEN2_BESBE|nr:SAG-related sequence [Besnoitia besnoiti]PFH36968.1 SAG-related sequence [Besnoitia besnoiti]
MIVLLLLTSTAARESLYGVAAQDAQECSSKDNPLYLRVTSNVKPIKFKCSGKTSKLGIHGADHACVDSDCNNAPIPIKDLVKLTGNDGAGYDLQLVKANQEPQTIYFNCVSDAVVARRDRRVQDASAQEICKVQVSLLDETKKFAEKTVAQCGKDIGTVDIDIRSAPMAKAFTCGDDGTITPRNFEQVFKGPTGEEVGLQEMLSSGKLFESGMLDKKVVYTLSLEALPPEETQLVYKCTYPNEVGVRSPGPEAAAKECIVTVNVAAANTPKLPNDGTQPPPTNPAKGAPTSSVELNARGHIAGAFAVSIPAMAVSWVF